jgi:small-conductance mechanosensitive channel
MNHLIQWVQSITGISPVTQERIYASILIIVFLWLVHNLIIMLRFRYTKDINIRYRWKKTTGHMAVLLGMIIIGWVWLREIKHITAFLGLFSAGIAIALKDLIVNIAGWTFIVWRRPFGVGDRIEIGEHAGDVIDIRIFQFTILEIGNWVDGDQSTGRIIHIPNGKVFNETLANYSKGFQYIWDEVPVMITFESNWKKAKEILLTIANSHARHLSESAKQKVKEASQKFMIFYSHLTPTVYTSVKDSGILLTIRYLCEPRGRRNSLQTIWEDILQEFGGCTDIDFAYPTQRFYNNMLEGKPGTENPSDEV